MKYKEKYIWALIGRFTPQFIYLITTMILSRFLSPDDFGKIGVLSIFFVVANVLMDAGLGGSLIKEKELHDIDSSTIFVFNISISIILYVILFVCSGLIEEYFDVDGLARVVKILCLLFVINSFGLVPHSLLIRQMRFKAITLINILGVILASFSSIFYALYGGGVYALVTYQLVNAIIVVIMSLYKSKFKVSLRFSILSFKKLIPFGIFTTLTTTVDTIYENLMTFLFGKYLSIQQAGYLYQAKRLEEVPSQGLARTINSVSFPVLTKLRDTSQDFKDECESTFKTVMLLAIPVLVTIAVFSEQIIWFVFGDKWLDSAPYLTLLIIAAIFHIAETLNRTFIKATCQVNLLFVYTIYKRIVGIVIIFITLIYNVSLVLWGYILSTFIGFLFNIYLLSKVSNVRMGRQIKLFLIYILPSIGYYFLMIFINSCINTVIFQFILSSILLIIYYFYILSYYDIHIVDWIKKMYLHKSVSNL